jgi:hypothetical protein
VASNSLQTTEEPDRGPTSTDQDVTIQEPGRRRGRPRATRSCDLMDEDETEFVWTFLTEARDPSLIGPDALVVAGDSDAPAVAQVVEIVDKPAGPVVRLRLLPGAIEDYEALVRRTIIRT